MLSTRSIPSSPSPPLPSPHPPPLSLSVFPFFRFLTLTYLFVPVSLIPCFSFLCLISFLCFYLFFSLYIVSLLLIRRSLRVIRMSMSIVLLIGQTVEQLNSCHEKSTLFEFILFILSLFSCFFVIFRLPTFTHPFHPSISSSPTLLPICTTSHLCGCFYAHRSLFRVRSSADWRIEFASYLSSSMSSLIFHLAENSHHIYNCSIVAKALFSISLIWRETDGPVLYLAGKRDSYVNRNGARCESEMICVFFVILIVFFYLTIHL